MESMISKLSYTKPTQTKLSQLYYPSTFLNTSQNKSPIEFKTRLNHCLSSRFLPNSDLVDNDGTIERDHNSNRDHSGSLHKRKKTIDINLDPSTILNSNNDNKQKGGLNKNSTAMLLLKRAKVGKMQRKWQQKEGKAVMPEVTDIGKKHRRQFPQLPSLTHRASSALIPLSSNLEGTKE